jgi:hypothetical protein
MQEERRWLRQNGASYMAIAARAGLSQTGAFDIGQRLAVRTDTGLISGSLLDEPELGETESTM